MEIFSFVVLVSAEFVVGVHVNTLGNPSYSGAETIFPSVAVVNNLQTSSRYRFS